MAAAVTVMSASEERIEHPVMSASEERIEHPVMSASEEQSGTA